ncbi:MAG: cytochrome c [Campylobacteraceae bacterium]|jgi:mono/diheme cytochrome c family protein|nr:cytochrome c [Campylobacteraceae bacterium]
MKKTIISVLVLCNILSASPELNTGEKVFKAYCWGCHHQTSVAFGPSFAQMANKRTIGEIQGHIISPKAMYKQLGHKRSVMPAFGDKLSQKEIDLITEFILSFKGAI